MAEDYHGLLEALQVSKVRVVGVSMGSTIAMQLCLRHPDEVSSMVLMCPWARCDRMARSIFEHMIAIKGKLTPAEFARYIQLLIFHKSSWDHDDVYQEMIDGRLAAQEDESPQPFHALEAQAIACMEHNVLSQLPNIFQPCLILGGKADIFTPEWMARKLLQRFRDLIYIFMITVGMRFIGKIWMTLIDESKIGYCIINLGHSY